ncbi:MAG: hypothetical protein LRS48_06275 [Desulfurococcales archaeon]|nr:hypothetical protein [Desulfurococcales archaeon]
MVKAKVEEHGDLLIVKTEYGQVAVIPRERICELIARFNLEIDNLPVNCEIRRGEDYIEYE